MRLLGSSTRCQVVGGGNEREGGGGRDRKKALHK